MAISQIPCSDCSYFFPTVRAQHLAGQALAHLSLFQMAISQIPALTAHISYLLWELKIWQTRSWQIYPPSKEQFHIFLPYSESSYLADQVLGNLPHFKWQFYRFLLWLLIFLSYSESSTFGRPGHGTSTPLSNGNFTDSCSDCSYFFPTLRAQHFAGHLFADLPPFKWHFHRFLFYSESSTFGRPGLGTCTPLSNGNFTDSFSDCSYFFPTLRVQHLADQILADLYQFKWQFHRFMPYSGSSYLEDEVLEDLPPLQMAISAIPALTVYILFLFRSSTFGRLVLEHPPFKWQFHRFLPYCEGSYLAYQVLADLPSLSIGNFKDSTSDCSYFILPLRAQHLAGHGLAHLPLFQKAISQILALTAHISFLLWELNIWQTRS